MRVSDGVLYRVLHRISRQAGYGVMLAGLLTTGHAPRVRAQQANPPVAWPNVAVFDIACKYKNETYKLRGRVIRRENSPDVAQYQSGSVNALGYLFPTGSCADLCAYFDPYAIRPTRTEDAARLKTLPSEILNGVPCRV